MSNISSNCLFHFTSKAEYLIGILKNEFLPRYCWEEINLKDGDYGSLAAGIPMVCFCDISLGQISKHVSTYGSYGIGMTKEWGVKNKLNPVIYVNEGSNVAKPIGRMAESVVNLIRQHRERTGDDNNEDLSNLSDDWRSLAMYVKPYVGSIKRNGVLINNVRFYDEREWRYLPKGDGESLLSTLEKGELENSIKLASENQKIERYKLSFEPDDIKYIFVKDENEIHSMVEALRSIKSEKYYTKTIDILTSKILTTTQILEDF